MLLPDCVNLYFQSTYIMIRETFYQNAQASLLQAESWSQFIQISQKIRCDESCI